MTDQFFRAITPTHKDCRVILQMIFFSTCIKNGRQCTKYRHIWPKSRTQTLIIHNILFTLLHFCLLFTLSFFVKFVCLFVGFVYVSVLLFYLVYDLHLFVLVTLSRTLLNCVAWFVVFLFSLSHDLIIIGIINNITSLSDPIEGPNLHFILLFFYTRCWKDSEFQFSLASERHELNLFIPAGWDATMVNETGTKQWTKHRHKHTHDDRTHR